MAARPPAFDLAGALRRPLLRDLCHPRVFPLRLLRSSRRRSRPCNDIRLWHPGRRPRHLPVRSNADLAADALDRAEKVSRPSVTRVFHPQRRVSGRPYKSIFQRVARSREAAAAAARSSCILTPSKEIDHGFLCRPRFRSDEAWTPFFWTTPFSRSKGGLDDCTHTRGFFSLVSSWGSMERGSGGVGERGLSLGSKFWGGGGGCLSIQAYKQIKISRTKTSKQVSSKTQYASSN